MPRVSHELLLPASPTRVWDLLLATEAYATWNPRLVRVDGRFAAGGVVTLHYRQDRWWMPPRYVVDVVTCDAERELCWRGPRSPAKALLRASHSFHLEPGPEPDTCRLVHAEVFEGALAGALWPLLGPAVEAGHAAVNGALARHLGA